MTSKYGFLLFLLTASVAVASCKKYIEKRPNSNVLVPTTPAEFQGLLDNPQVFIYGHKLGLLSADEFYFSPSFYYNSISSSEQKAYTWQPEIFSSTEIPFDWTKAYEGIFNANVVLEGLIPLMTNITDNKLLNNLKGDALFKRALAHFLLIQLFAMTYDPSTAINDMGIPLKLKTDLDEPVTRPSMQSCLNKLLSDLEDAVKLLPDTPDPSHLNRASKAAALALSARIHLYMGNWQQSATNAQDAIMYFRSLIDFNTLDVNSNKPFKSDMREVIYYLKAPDLGGQNSLLIGLTDTIDNANVDTALIQLYAQQDLRLPVYFRQRSDKSWTLKSTLTGNRTPFEGICVSEVFLTLAEAQARIGNTTSALTSLNDLLANRYKAGQITPALPSGTDGKAVLERILSERQKELAFRGLRWMDIKRLNKVNVGIMQYRFIEGKEFSIAPNDLRYALLLPASTIEKYSIDQNAR